MLVQMYEKVRAMTCALGELPSKAKPFPFGFKPIFSLDNASVHKTAMEDPKWLQEHPWINNRQKLPCYSGDLHKVVEHAHGVVSRAFKNRLRNTAAHDTVAEYCDDVAAIFYKLKPESIKKDVLSLTQTCQQVIQLHGEYPAKKYR